MADTSNLSQFLTDVADAIRTKKETTEPIPAANFDSEILDITTGMMTKEDYKNACSIATEINPDGTVINMFNNSTWYEEYQSGAFEIDGTGINYYRRYEGGLCWVTNKIDGLTIGTTYTVTFTATSDNPVIANNTHVDIQDADYNVTASVNVINGQKMKMTFTATEETHYLRMITTEATFGWVRFRDFMCYAGTGDYAYTAYVDGKQIDLNYALSNILIEKNTDILPENIRRGVTIFDVEGTVETGATSMITLPKYMVYTPKDSASGFENVNDTWVENYTGNISYDVYTQSKILCLIPEATEMTINYTGTGTGWYYACLICSTLDEQFPMYNPLVPTNDAKYVHKTLFNSTNYTSATYTIPAGVHTITVRGQQKDNYYNYTTAYTNQNKFTLSDTSTVELPFRGLYIQLPDYNDFDLLDVIIINNELAIRNTDGWFILDDFRFDDNTVAETVSENLHEINSTTTLYHLQGNYFFTVDTSLDNSSSLTYYVLANDELLKLTSFYNSNAYTEFYGYITDEYNERRLFDYLGSEYSSVTGNRRVWKSENDYAYVINGNLSTHYTFIAGPMQVTTYDWNNPSTPGEVLTLEGCYLPMSVYEDCKVSDTLFEATSDFLEVIDTNGMSQYVTRIEVIIND